MDNTAGSLDKVAGVAPRPVKRKVKAPKDIQRVEFRDKGPIGGIPRPKLASAISGLAYERKFGKALTRELGADEFLRSAQWLWYVADHKASWAQTDHLLITANATVIFECKLTHTPTAASQLMRLYGPLIRWFVRPQRLVLVEVCKNLADGWDAFYRVRCLEEIMLHAPPDTPCLLHWTGGPIPRREV